MLNETKKQYTLALINEDGDAHSKLKNVQIKVAERNFVIVLDDKGKEHIFTGSTGIRLDEI